MGPFFALLHSLGLAPWVAQRIWLALMFFSPPGGCCGCSTRCSGAPRGVVHFVAAGVLPAQPVRVSVHGADDVTLLGYAALPWLLDHLTRACDQPAAGATVGGWWWAAAFGLILTSTGGGVNAAVVGWMLVGPLVLALYEPAIGAVPWRNAIGFLAAPRCSACWPRCGGSRRCWCTSATGSTSCSSPSSRARSGRPTASPSRCA